ncbi:hypothetical protein [Glycomyces sp. NRRL B-16210]|uniref:hypothetical protein n=1 Tax=Glycomyces sp. NRRL B-16210 TaxID=1463821 RepID=UPI0004C00201|nr:hypothetical protein [Glycomyces sp. NRRL B-16210]
MAKIPHEALHRIFRDDPSLFTRTLRRVLSADFPEIEEVSVIDTDLTTTGAIERRVDTILKAETAEGSRLLVIEPQTAEKKEKIRSWAYYLSFLENKYKIPATLLVITPKAATARWARGALTLGPPERPSMRIFPFVCGPDNMPFITDPEQAAEDVVFTVLALLSHRLDPDIEKSMRPLADALTKLEPKTASYWFEFTEGGLGEGCARNTWRNIMKTMNYGYVSETRREARDEGRAEALADAILSFFDDRDLAVSGAERERITTCDDVDLLKRWLLLAPSVASAAALFED